MVTSPSVTAASPSAGAALSVVSSSSSTPGVTNAQAHNNSAPATIQTFQITTSTGVQTIRVAAPANLPTALLARTLQISAQQQNALQSQKVAGAPVTALLNGNASIKQVLI